MRGRFGKVVAALVLAAAGAGSAVVLGQSGAGSGVGDHAFKVNSVVYGGDVVQVSDDPRSPSYAVPAGGGVITAWTVQMINITSAGTIKFKVYRPQGGEVWSVVGSSDGTVAMGDTVRRYEARIAVQAGDRIGGYAPNSQHAIGSEYDPSAPGDIHFVPGDATVGQTLTTETFAAHSRMALSATVEPDADADGYGDDSQDSCPADHDVHAGACVTDLAVTATAGAPGATVVLSGAVAAARGIASAAAATLTLPAGVELAAGAADGGECAAGPPVTCPLGDLAPGRTGHVVLALRGTAGTYPLTLAAGSATPDGNSANDTASATVTIAPPAVADLCVVPPLKGLGRKAAAKLLKAFHCVLGKARTTKRPRKGRKRVISSKPKAGARRPAGTPVAITLKRRR